MLRSKILPCLIAGALCGILSSFIRMPGSQAASDLRPVMTRLADSLRTLLTLSNSPLAWEDSKNRTTIERHLKILLDQAHEVRSRPAKSANVSGLDLQILQPYLVREASITHSAFKISQYEYARQNLRNLISTCIECHSREPEMQPLLNPDTNGDFKRLEPLDQARFYSAIRNFDRSIEHYHRVLFTPGMPKNDLYAWERAFRETMNLLIRVKRDPTEATALIKKLRQITTLPFFLRHELGDWEKSLQEWSKETPKKSVNESTDFHEIHHTLNLLNRQRSYLMDHSADALSLRLSTLLHDFLRNYPKSRNIPEAWYYLGIAQQTLNLPPVDNLHEKYLEACIRSRPHSPLAMRCYSRLEQSVYSGFTGSSGTHLPDEVRSQLLELWGISFIPKQTNP
jgi:hypothetical protein